MDIWYRGFVALLNELTRASGVDRDALLDDARRVHQTRGTSEYAFLVEEMDSLRALRPGEDLAHVYRSALDARRDARAAALRLYPGVRETLSTLRAAGVLVVGYTESTAFYTSDRVRKLGLDGLLDLLYSPPDHLGRAERARIRRRHAPGYYELRSTVHRHTPPGELKPNPRLLLDILADVGARPEQAVYVGDSPMKDVAMAQEAGVRDALALYGKAQDRAAYDLLRRVTHWTDADVERERRVLTRGEVVPTWVLRESFAELTEHFEFEAFAPAVRPQPGSGKARREAQRSATRDGAAEPLLPIGGAGSV